MVTTDIGTLPAGLAFDSSTGEVSGTPAAAYATANVVFSVKDADGTTANTASTVAFTVTAVATAYPSGTYISEGGLTWMPATLNFDWTDANAYCNNTAIDGVTGWRLPTQTEAENFSASFGGGFGYSSYGWSSSYMPYVWTSTAAGSGSHYLVELDDGYGFSMDASDVNQMAVTCVR